MITLSSPYECPWLSLSEFQRPGQLFDLPSIIIAYTQRLIQMIIFRNKYSLEQILKCKSTHYNNAAAAAVNRTVELTPEVNEEITNHTLYRTGILKNPKKCL